MRLPFGKLRVNRGHAKKCFLRNEAKFRRGAPIYVILPNEANFSKCFDLWSSLRDNVLGVEVGQFVTWLRLTPLEVGS